METTRIAEIIYNLGCDIDYMCYLETMEVTLKELTIALQHVKDLGVYNKDFKLLYEVLEQIADTNEYTRDFVAEMRNS